jgi:uncharacterized protein (DUF302 family)
MKKIVVSLLVGAALALFAVWSFMPKIMLRERVSPVGYQETINRIKQKVEAHGWVVASTSSMDKKLAKHGEKIPPILLINICQPEYASAILNDESARKIAVMMPCTIAVYSKSDGKTYISTMDTGLMGKMFGGTIAKVMGGSVAEEEKAFTDFAE